MPETEQRKLAVIMLTDMVGYSALTDADEGAALNILDKHNSLIRSFVHRHGGHEIKTIGDAFLVEFTSVLEAIRCATEIQNTLAEYNTTVDKIKQFWLRIGIHLGDVVYRSGDVFGEGVNIASRIEPIADPGGVCFSEDVYNQIRTRPEFKVDFLGVHELKNIVTPMALYQIHQGMESQQTGRKLKRPPSKARPNWLVPVLVTSLLTPVLLLLFGGVAWLAFFRPSAPATEPPGEVLADGAQGADSSTPAQTQTAGGSPTAPPSTSPSTSPSTTGTTQSRRSRLQLEGTHSFENGTLYVFSNTRMVKTLTLRADSNGVGRFSTSVSLSPGDHLLEVRIRSSKDNFDKSESIQGKFSPRQTRTLLVRMGKSGGFLGMGRNKDFKLDWAD
jgi:class 3 adenylate cyclase